MLLMSDKIVVLFVCLGNICCLFIVEVVFKKKVYDVGFDLIIDFVGIYGYYIGSLFDKCL